MESLIIPIVDRQKQKISIENSSVKDYDIDSYNKKLYWKDFLLKYSHPKKYTEVYLITPVLSTITFVKKLEEKSNT